MKKKTKNKKKIVSKNKNFESHYLAIILVVFLLVEGYFISSTQLSDWQKGMKILDVSEYVTRTTSNVSFIMQPVSEAVAGVDTFYQLAATAMTEILDMSSEGPIDQVSQVTSGVNEFYQQASWQITDLLDVSSVSSWPAQVAGVSVIVQ